MNTTMLKTGSLPTIKLSVNRDKTKCMLFSSNRYRDKNVHLNLNSSFNADDSDVTIEQVNTFKYLGVYLDSHLNFNTHCDKLGKCIRSRTFILQRMRNFILESLDLSLYKSLIEPHFSYADIVYDGCNVTHSKQLQVQQNQALRAVLNVDCRYSTSALHTKTGVKWLDVSRKERCCIEVYKVLNGLSLVGIEQLFPPATHNRTLRSSAAPNFVPRLNKTALADKNFPTRCYWYWKCLPDHVKLSPSLLSFKTAVHSGNYFEHNYWIILNYLTHALFCLVLFPCLPIYNIS